ncbi:MAG: class I SAM-dependent methyltransferase [Acidobacteriia bacterium]|nr:class I SAM-dependent methyltransferase [Terriglobia bacterium]
MTPREGAGIPPAAADNWDAHWLTYGSSAAFNPAQAFRRDLILRLIGQAPDASRLLDIGSGQGDLALALRGRLPRAQILGLELSEAGIRIASAKVPGARFLQCDLLQSVNPPSEFHRWANVAVCSEVLEHVDDPVALLRNSRVFLAPGCRVVVTVPGGPMSAFDRHIGHRRHYSPHALRDLLQEAGFRPDFAAGAGFPFFNLYRLAVILRGARLVERAQAQSVDRLAPSEKLILRTFQRLLRWTSAKGEWGWQIVASAHENAG